MTIKNVETYEGRQGTPYDVSLNKMIQKAIDKGKIHPLQKASEPIRIKVTRQN